MEGEANVRVSEFYNLNKSQSELDFVDVDIVNDVELYIDPSAIAHLSSPWADSCIASIQSFFQRVLDAIGDSNDEGAISLLAELREPNETHLGQSSGRSQGSGLGDKLAEKFWESLSNSRAARSGLLEDLEDTALLVEGVDKDRISDITTNLIRAQLVEFTQETAEYHGIELTPDVAYGPFWDPLKGEWYQKYTNLPTPNGERLLLVPKAIARRGLHLSASEFYRHTVLNYLVIQERAERSLGAVIRSRRGVTKTSVNEVLKEQFDAGRHNPGVEKRINTWATQQNPELLRGYKEEKAATGNPPLPNEDLAERVGSDTSRLRDLLEDVLRTPAGRDDADAYERRIESFLSALFYPHLVFPRRQKKIHDGRKRIDISYTNAATHGFFYWLAMHYPAAHIVVECKNYGKELRNPEFDQLQGRFSPSRGKVGLLLHRGYGDKEKVWSSCRDTARDDRGFIIALDDDDLRLLVQESEAPTSAESFGYLHKLFQKLID
ncbi:hypothetical protein ACGF7U_08395 [Micromonospora sp. NPDC047670]|uniref:hypothetical protein n=1 Tax=Micromonospora sp. NPDC047670 TaxID=3364252 RepID=UPI003711015B